jgi:hypothetical protein
MPAQSKEAGVLSKNKTPRCQIPEQPEADLVEQGTLAATDFVPTAIRGTANALDFVPNATRVESIATEDGSKEMRAALKASRVGSAATDFVSESSQNISKATQVSS